MNGKKGGKKEGKTLYDEGLVTYWEWFEMNKKGCLEEIRDEEFFELGKGRKELGMYVNGESLTAEEAILAKCCDCRLAYKDQERICRKKTCPLYPFMPYREGSK
jgi:hypothetical protein